MQENLNNPVAGDDAENIAVKSYKNYSRKATTLTAKLSLK